jgi:hypothetical protein
MNRFLYLIIFITTLGCAKIPSQSVDLFESIYEEGTRMHKLNILLVNQLFDERKLEITNRVEKEYVPKLIENIKLKAEKDGKNFEKDVEIVLPLIINNTIDYRDSFFNQLEKERLKIISQLATDYRQFETSIYYMRNLLKSAVEVDRQRNQILNQATKLSQNRINFEEIESKIDQLSIDIGKNIDSFLNQ